jgi:hypothetical protein
MSIINPHSLIAKPSQAKARSAFLKSASTADFIRHLHQSCIAFNYPALCPDGARNHNRKNKAGNAGASTVAHGDSRGIRCKKYSTAPEAGRIN